MFVFPLLEYEVLELTTVNADLVFSHMLWLQQSAEATQEEFATKYMRKESTNPNAFFVVHATVLTMGSGVIDQWLALEMNVCAKKINAQWAHKTKLFKYYSIAFERKRKGKQFSYSFKFPHIDKAEEVSEEEVFARLAGSGFPGAKDTSRYDKVTISTKAVEAVEQFL